MCGEATAPHRLPAPGLGCRPPGARDEDSLQWAYGESLACPCLTGSRASLCRPQTMGPDGWISPYGISEGLAAPGPRKGGWSNLTLEDMGTTLTSGTMDSSGQSQVPVAGRFPVWLVPAKDTGLCCLQDPQWGQLPVSWRL